jgi:plasmid stabilization system protein ParE
MNLPLEFNAAVRTETAQAHDWYAKKLNGLGREFLYEAEQVLEKITQNPTLYGFAEADIREALFTRFPFAVYYRVLANRIRVLAVYHTSRDPEGWRSRA